MKTHLGTLQSDIFQLHLPSEKVKLLAPLSELRFLTYANARKRSSRSHFHNVNHGFALRFTWLISSCAPKKKKKARIPHLAHFTEKIGPLNFQIICTHCAYTVVNTDTHAHVHTHCAWTGVLRKSPMIVNYFTMTVLMKIYCLVLGNLAQQSIWSYRLGNTLRCEGNRLKKMLFD